jgi:hypothetical protein
LYFKILKSGCNIEQMQLENYKRIKAALAIYMIIAWRIQYITMIARVIPNKCCDLLFSQSEWQSVYMVINKGAPPLLQAPTMYQMIRMIAKLGGFLGRKSDGEPGIKTIWIGWQKMKDYAMAWEIFNLQTKTCG